MVSFLHCLILASKMKTANYYSIIITTCILLSSVNRINGQVDNLDGVTDLLSPDSFGSLLNLDWLSNLLGIFTQLGGLSNLIGNFGDIEQFTQVIANLTQALANPTILNMLFGLGGGGEVLGLGNLSDLQDLINGEMPLNSIFCSLLQGVSTIAKSSYLNSTANALKAITETLDGVLVLVQELPLQSVLPVGVANSIDNLLPAITPILAFVLNGGLLTFILSALFVLLIDAQCPLT